VGIGVQGWEWSQYREALLYKAITASCVIDTMLTFWKVLGSLIPLSLLGIPVCFWAVRRSASKEEPLTSGQSLEFRITRGFRLLLLSVFCF